MQLIGFIHGIGDFMPTRQDKVDALISMQRSAERTYGAGNVKVVYLPYEQLLDSKLSSKAITLAASAASTYYLGTPALGRILSDYGDDIWQYYLTYKTRRDIAKEVIGALVNCMDAVGAQNVTGITLVGHSLGSLVLTRIMSMIQIYSDSRGKIQSSDKLVDEILADARLQQDLIRIGDHTVHPILVGSPAFSRIKSFKLMTRKLALAESRLEDMLSNQIALGQPMAVNIESQHAMKDPLSGPVDKSFKAINVEVDTTHSDAARYFDAAMAFLQTCLTDADRKIG